MSSSPPFPISLSARKLIIHPMVQRTSLIRLHLRVLTQQGMRTVRHLVPTSFCKGRSDSFLSCHGCQLQQKNPNPTMSGMDTNRHYVSLSFCVKALSKGRYGSPLVAMPKTSRSRAWKSLKKIKRSNL
eukprot:1161079-Pelagomonas_calceolata.AAC.18